MKCRIEAGQKVAACLLDGTWVPGIYQGRYFNFDKSGNPLIQCKIVRGSRDNVYSIASECIPIEDFKGELYRDPYYEEASRQSEVDIDFGVWHYHR